MSIEGLVADAARLAGGRRRLLGLTGPPGAGKSVLADALQRALGERAVVVGMDGFHLAQRELLRLRRVERKGAPDTFDAGGYVALLRRLRAQDEAGEPVVHAPLFDRSLEEPIGSAVPVFRDTPLVITEGNYLLLDTHGFAPVAGLLDECWYLDPPDDLRLKWLTRRHTVYGRDPAQAYGSDERNAALIRASRGKAGRIVRPALLAIPDTAT